MIHVITPPGCYGTYISRCLHYYCDLSLVPYTMDFDKNGSNHSYRSVKKNTATSALNIHWNTNLANMNLLPEKTVVITADLDHLLDYHNNQFAKQDQYNLLEKITSYFSIKGVEDKLKTHWNYTGKFDSSVPLWIVREFCSLWLIDSWNDMYNIKKYIDLPHVYSFCCSRMWENNFYELFVKIAQAIGHQVYDSKQNIENNHDKFLKVQKFHNSQQRMIEWTNDIINGKDTANTCQTIFDEAYVQHLLRQYGFEIKCDGLNVFPMSSTEMKKLIYETRNNSN